MRPTGWKYGINATSRQPLAANIITLAGRIEAAAGRLKRVTLENRDAFDLIRDYGAEPCVCIYADPPYLGSTRAANYGVEMLADDTHIALADALNNCKASVVLSGYDSPLYVGLFADWHRTDLPVTRGLHGRATEPEVLWSNVPLDVQGVLDFGGVA